jgi:uncharacterized damage-inducible protein DinB
MNDDFHALYAYNRWANLRVLDACRKLTAEQYSALPAAGWSSVRSTIVHIATVTEGWLRGLAGETLGAVLTEAELPAVDDAARLLDRAEAILADLLPQLTPERLTTPQVLSGRGRTATLQPWVVLRHVVNHSSYHRGQVASKLKCFGIEQPATDFVFWALEQTIPKP